MLPDDLARIDLHALQLLVTVHDTGSFSTAAGQLDVSQSTVSYTIERLRKAFGDPLFVRQGNMISATGRCSELVVHARDMVNRMMAIAVPDEFDPAMAEGTITLSCNHHERILLMPDYIKAARARAPNVGFILLESTVNGKQQLKENMADIVLGPVRILGDGYFRRSIFTDHYACVMDRRNPLMMTELTLARYQSAAHVTVTHNGQWQALYFDALRANGIHLKPQLTLPTHDSLELMIVGTNFLATIPDRLAKTFGPDVGVVPFPIPTPIDIDMYWTERTHRSGLHRWARQLLVEVAKTSINSLSGDA